MIKFPKEMLSARAARLASNFVVIKPDTADFGRGPFPTTILMHGCGDQFGPQPDYARAAALHGVASIIVDSYTSRQVSKVEAASLICSGLRFWGRERAGDVVAALHWARLQDWVDQDVLSLAGWSHGGWSVMDTLALGPEVGRHAAITNMDANFLDGVQSAFMVYPWCGAGAQTPSRGWIKPVRAFMLLAEKDSVAGVRFPLRALAAAAKSGADTDSMVFPGATHCFDEEVTINPTFKFDPTETARATALYARWISGVS
jgi:dienelactone hydrolase